MVFQVAWCIIKDQFTTGWNTKLVVSSYQWFKVHGRTHGVGMT